MTYLILAIALAILVAALVGQLYRINHQLKQLGRKLDQAQRRETDIMATQEQLQAALDDLAREQTEQTDATEAMTAVFTTQFKMLREALEGGGTSDEKIAQIRTVVAALDANQQKIIEATLANTLADPTNPTPTE